MRLLLVVLSSVLLCAGCGKAVDEPRNSQADTASVSYPCLTGSLKNGLVAAYTFSGGSLEDRSGNSPALQRTSGVQFTQDRMGRGDCAVLFPNQGGQYLVATDGRFLDGQDQFAVSLWYRSLDSSRQRGLLEGLISRDTGLAAPDKTGQWSVSLYDCGRAVFGRSNSVWEKSAVDGMPADNCEAGSRYRTRRWNHVVAVFDSPAGRMWIYHNGKLHDTGPIFAAGQQISYRDTGGLFLGWHYYGLLDDVLLYNRALTAGEVLQLYRTEPCCGLLQ